MALNELLETVVHPAEKCITANAVFMELKHNNSGNDYLEKVFNILNIRYQRLGAFNNFEEFYNFLFNRKGIRGLKANEDNIGALCNKIIALLLEGDNPIISGISEAMLINLKNMLVNGTSDENITAFLRKKVSSQAKEIIDDNQGNFDSRTFGTHPSYEAPIVLDKYFDNGGTFVELSDADKVILAQYYISREEITGSVSIGMFSNSMSLQYAVFQYIEKEMIPKNPSIKLNILENASTNTETFIIVYGYLSNTLTVREYIELIGSEDVRKAIIKSNITLNKDTANRVLHGMSLQEFCFEKEFYKIFFGDSLLKFLNENLKYTRTTFPDDIDRLKDIGIIPVSYTIWGNISFLGYE